MDLSIVTNFISPIILIACLGIGYTIHTLKNKILNSFIPIISATLGIIFAIWSLGIVDLSTIVTGMISGLAATGLYEAFKNILNLPQTYSDVMALPDIPYGEPATADDFAETPRRGEHFSKE